jgi:uncharacterized protein YjbI with pentapeptide repeats
MNKSLKSSLLFSSLLLSAATFALSNAYAMDLPEKDPAASSMRLRTLAPTQPQTFSSPEEIEKYDMHCRQIKQAEYNLESLQSELEKMEAQNTLANTAAINQYVMPQIALATKKLDALRESQPPAVIRPSMIAQLESQAPAGPSSSTKTKSEVPQILNLEKEGRKGKVEQELTEEEMQRILTVQQNFMGQFYDILPRILDWCSDLKTFYKFARLSKQHYNNIVKFICSHKGEDLERDPYFEKRVDNLIGNTDWFFYQAPLPSFVVGDDPMNIFLKNKKYALYEYYKKRGYFHTVDETLGNYKFQLLDGIPAGKDDYYNSQVTPLRIKQGEIAVFLNKKPSNSEEYTLFFRLYHTKPIEIMATEDLSTGPKAIHVTRFERILDTLQTLRESNVLRKKYTGHFSSAQQYAHTLEVERITKKLEALETAMAMNEDSKAIGKYAVLRGAIPLKLNQEIILPKNSTLAFLKIHTDDLKGTNSSYEHLHYKNLSYATIHGELSNKILTGINFSHADITQLSLDRSDLTQSNLSYTCPKKDLIKTCLQKAILDHTDLSGTSLRKSDLSNAQAPHANFCKANINDVFLNFINLTDADLSGSIIKNSNFSSANLTRAKLIGVPIECSSFEDANLSEADFTNAEIKEVKLTGAIRTNAIGLPPK